MPSMKDVASFSQSTSNLLLRLTNEQIGEVWKTRGKLNRDLSDFAANRLVEFIWGDSISGNATR